MWLLLQIHFINSTNPDYSKEPDALNDALKLKEKFDPFLNHNKAVNYNQKLKLFVPLSKFIARLIESGKSRDEIYEENGILDYIFEQLDKKIISNSNLFTNKFINDLSSWSLKDFKNYVSKIKQPKREKIPMISKKQSKYKLFLFDNFDEYKEKYGHGQTGYEGESEWCSIQNKDTYDQYLEDSQYKYFLVLEKDGWKKIKPEDSLHGKNPKTHNPYDEYGLSLICLVINFEQSKLEVATLRWNHLGDFDVAKTRIPNEGSDNAFISFESLSEIIGFDVKKEALNKFKKCNKKSFLKLKDERKRLEKYQNFQGTFLEKLQDIANNSPYILKKEYIENDNNSENQKYFENLKIPDGIKEIGNKTFNEWKIIKTVELPDSLENLGNWCFSNCKELEFIKLSKNLKTIPWSCFNGCNNLKSIEIPDSVISLDDSAFNDCGLENIKLSKNLKEILYHCFYLCKNLKSIEIPDSVEEFGNFCFAENLHLETIKLSNGLKKIPYHCFERCFNLKSIKIPDSVEEFSDGCFFECKNLETIKLSNQLKNLGKFCFYDCEKLKFLEIPKSVIILPAFCFGICLSLEKIIILGKVSNIDFMAFNGCSSLKEIICKEKLTYDNIKGLNLENVKISLQS